MSSGNTSTPSAPPVPARLRRRLICLIYETLLLAAVIMAAALPMVMLTSGWQPLVSRTLLQIYLVILCGLYFVWQWVRTGQTLAMKTWRLKVVTNSGDTLSPAQATKRYGLALAGCLACGLGFAWVLVDRNRMFLHDRLAGTLIVNTAA